MQISIDLCLFDLESYKSGDMIFKTHLAEEIDTMEKVGDHYEYHGHKLTVDKTNYSALKSVFLNKLIQNIRDRFPAKSLIDSFFVLAMRTINFEKDIMSYGTEEIECLLKHYGEKQ
ncbi:uncharacterized protein LOC134241257, partial [Saccostrea cucullata]|uniref:uncharacterized protein LOC134241257 n=1 Tax=Saccostrea cuccullata TaxID=36930 RepID=UPI002ED2E39E